MHRALVLLAACGRIDFEPLVGDAATDAPAGAIDASTECRWSTPVAQTALNTGDGESEPVLSPDGTRIVFSSNRMGNIDRLFIATRTQTGWTPPMLIAPLDSGAGDNGPAWNATGTRLYFSSYRAGPLRLYQSPFDNNIFGAPSLVPGLEGLAESIAPTVRGDELEMFFSSRLSPSRIEYATRPTTASTWTPRGNVTELVDVRDHGYPGSSADGLALYFEVQRSGGFFIAVARRESTLQSFGPVQPVVELDATGSHGDPAPSFDGNELVFASDRASPGNFDIYLSTRVCN